MSQYTTGEMAKACGVTVRTVQFYDQKGILIPSSLTDGGRRLYSEDDLKKLKIVCFLREAGLSLDTIGQLLQERENGSVISIILEEQEKVLTEEITSRQEKLARLEEIRKGLKAASFFSLETLGDIATVMENKKKLNTVHRNLLISGVVLEALQWAGILLWIFKGIWWLFAVWTVLAVVCGVAMTRYYHRNVAYICPQCHEVFKPTFKDMFFARHTFKTRRLTCANCGHHGFCVETWGGGVQ